MQKSPVEFWDLHYSLLAKMVTPDFAAKSYENAKEATGKDIARPDETKPDQAHK